MSLQHQLEIVLQSFLSFHACNPLRLKWATQGSISAAWSVPALTWVHYRIVSLTFGSKKVLVRFNLQTWLHQSAREWAGCRPVFCPFSFPARGQNIVSLCVNQHSTLSRSAFSRRRQSSNEFYCFLPLPIFFTYCVPVAMFCQTAESALARCPYISEASRSASSRHLKYDSGRQIARGEEEK
jgi:hypothetical protein